MMGEQTGKPRRKPGALKSKIRMAEDSDERQTFREPFKPNEFDEGLENRKGRFPHCMDEALVNVADTLEMAVKIARTRLGNNWTGADAIEICRLVLNERENLIRLGHKWERKDDGE